MNLGRAALKRTPWLRHAFGVAASVIATLSATATWAFPVELNSLPRSTPLGTLPKQVPASIPAKETLGALFATQTLTQYGEQYRGLTLYASEAEMRAFTAAGGVTTTTRPLTANTCFLVAAPAATGETEKVRGWDTSGERMPSVTSYPGYLRVAAVRMERFVESEGKTWLDVDDFWLDVVTGGARRFGQNRLEFKEIARPFDGIVLYAARTADDQVEVLLRSFEGRIQSQLYDKLGEEALLQLRQSGYPDASITVGALGLARNGCGQQRVGLQIPPNADALPALLPADSGSTRKLGKLGRVIQVPAFDFTPTRSLNNVSINLTPLTGWEQDESAVRTRFGTLRALETRPLAVNLGLSRLSADGAPILSVSYRWTADPSRVQVVTMDDFDQLIDLGS